MITLTKEATQSVMDALSAMSMTEPCDCGCPNKQSAVMLKPLHNWALANEAKATLQAAIDAPPPSGERAALLSRLANVRAMAYDRLPSCDVQTIDDVMGVLAADAQRGEIVVTRTQDGRLAAVTRQDDEGRILSVIAEADAPEQEPVEFLLNGARVKLNFNKIGNMTSLHNMQHDLQGRWVAFVGAENDKHLRAILPAPQAPAPTVPDNMQDWKGMDSTTAWHLIERHADNWSDIGKMMDEWLAANQSAPQARELSESEHVSGLMAAVRDNLLTTDQRATIYEILQSQARDLSDAEIVSLLPPITEGDRFKNEMLFRKLGFGVGDTLYECWGDAVKDYAMRSARAVLAARDQRRA